jgi:transposase InsO family protein
MPVKGLRQALGYKQQAPVPLRIWEWTSQRSSPVMDTGTSWFLSALTQSGLKLTRPHTEIAREVVKTLLREIIPRYGLPLSIWSDNGPAYVAEIVQGLAKILRIKWKVHTVYRPQSSGKVESMNWTLKITLVKLPRNTIPLDRHATISPAHGMLYS